MSLMILRTVTSLCKAISTYWYISTQGVLLFKISIILCIAEECGLHKIFNVNYSDTTQSCLSHCATQIQFTEMLLKQEIKRLKYS